MGYIKRTINIEELVSGGARCANPKIVWDDPLCAGITCKRNNGREIDVVIPDDCTERCFWVSYTCEDYCTTCEPIRLKICPCDTNADCENCHECHPIYEVCVSKCDEGEFCTDHDTCVECDETHPCPNGKQCVGGQCECPPEAPYLDSNGNCVPCTDDSCPEGQVCTPDGCVDPVCPSGHWLASENKCVECINTGHCDPGECCNPITHVCECCPGFVRDPATQQCVSAPCTEDKECPECTYCQTGVGCVPVICPDGKVCIPGEGCVDECNCSNPNCTGLSSACVSYSATICYCKDCAGSCANGQPCGEGCFCDDDLQCKPNPCANKTCTDGFECGKGCGCNQETHKCEPCSSAGCGDECDNLLGCECPNGTSCQDVNGCDGPCDGYGGCPLGCTCVGGQCVPCSDFSCETSDCSDRPECRCSGSGCEGDPDFCKDIFSTTDFDCGVTAELTLKDGCMCPGITAYATPHILTKNGTTYNVQLALRLAKGKANSWEEIRNLHLLDETQYDDIADNDTPTSGTMDLTVTEYYQPQTWTSGGWVNQGGIVGRVLPVSGSISFAGIARKENLVFQAWKIGSGKNIITNTSQEKIVRYDVEVKANVLKFPNNCTYESKTLPTMRLDNGQFKQAQDLLDQQSGSASYTDLFIHFPNGNFNLGGKFVAFEGLMSDSNRDPLFTWFRSEDNVYDALDIIRKLYITPDAPGYYKDSLFGPENFLLTKQNLVSPEGRVFGDMFYKVTNDCSCKDRELDFGKLVWCSPDSLALGNVVFSLCNKKIEIKSDITRPCVTNWDLREHDLHPDDNTTAFKNRHQARYHLMITLEDGTKIDRSYTWRETGVAAAGLYSETDNTSLKTYIQTFTSAIVDMRIELRYGTSTEVVCYSVKTIPAVPRNTPTYTKICEPNSNNIKYRFNTAVNHISTIVATGGTVVSGAGYKEIVATQGSLVTAYFTFTDYCPLTMELNEFCCDTLTIGFTVNQIPGPTPEPITQLTATVTGGTLPYNVKYYRQLTGGNKELVGESTNSTNSFLVLLSDATPGLYFATVTDGSGNCSKDSTVVSIEPRNEDDYRISIVPTFSGCTYTGNVSIAIPNQPDIVGSKVYYRVNTGSNVYFTVTSQHAAAGFALLPAVGQTITLVSLEIPNQSGPPTVFEQTGSATVPSNLSEAIPVLTIFTVNGSNTTTNVCAGSDVLIELTGSPNAVVQISGIEPITLDGSGYGVSTQVPLTNTTYTVTEVTNASGDCNGTQGVGLTRQAAVTPMPEITIVSDVCDGTGTLRTVTFSNITSATDQLGNTLTVTGSSVTVNVALVTEIRATYVLGICTATYTHLVTICGVPEITGDITAPTMVCAGETATVTVSGVTGGTAPYYYNYYTNSDFNETYTLGQTSKIYLFGATETVYVRIKDALDNISLIGSVIVQVAALPVPDITPAGDTGRIVEVDTNIFEIDNDVVNAVFKTVASYVSYGWEVLGTYAGTTTGSGPTFTIEVADITGTITLQVTVVSADGCIGTETVSISVVAAPAIIDVDEMLFVTSSAKIYKVEVTPSTIGIPVLLCGAGNPALSIAMRGNGSLISMNLSNLYVIDPLGGCGATLIGSIGTASNNLGMLTADIAVTANDNFRLSTYDLTDDSVVTNFYTISDGVNTYIPTGDLLRVGNELYGLAKQLISGVLQTDGARLLRFTLVSDAVVSFTNLGVLPIASLYAFGLAYLGSTAYVIYMDGKVYNLNLTTPSSSTLVGTIIVPGGESIYDTTDNF